MYLPGPTVCGFHGLFEENFGDPATQEPYCRVTPSVVAGIMLPFRCPRCKEVRTEFSDPKMREQYHDNRPGRDNHWCDDCGLRFRLRLSGITAPKKLSIYDGAAPSLVEKFTDSDDAKIVTHAEMQDNDTVTVVGRLLRHYIGGTDLLGAL